RLKSLVSVEGGHLVVHRCRLASGGAVGAGQGALIGFHAPGSLPLTRTVTVDGSLNWPFDRPTDKPTCRVTESLLLSGGAVLSAGVGRGLVFLSQCLVTSGGTAFSLTPDRVARHRLEADLRLEHRTVAAETNFVAP